MLINIIAVLQVTPIKPKMFPYSAMPFGRPRSVDVMSRSLNPSLEGHSLASPTMWRSSLASFHLTGKKSMTTSVDRLFETPSTHHSLLLPVEANLGQVTVPADPTLRFIIYCFFSFFFCLFLSLFLFSFFTGRFIKRCRVRMTSSVDLSGITSSSFGSCWDSFSSFDVLFSVCFFVLRFRLSDRRWGILRNSFTVPSFWCNI